MIRFETMRDAILGFIAFIAIAFVFALALAGPAKADGDKTNNPNVYSTPDQIEEYIPIGGTWVRKLNRVQLPNGRFMLDTKNPNYWRDFDKYPCSYRVCEDNKVNCSNPGDTYLDKLSVSKEPKPIPEPHTMSLMLTALLAYVTIHLYSKLKNEHI